MASANHSGASSEAVPSGDVGVAMDTFASRFSAPATDWLGSVTCTGGTAAVFEIWGRRSGAWKILGIVAEGEAIGSTSSRWFTMTDLRFFDRVKVRCAGVGPTYYVFTLEDFPADV